LPFLPTGTSGSQIVNLSIDALRTPSFLLPVFEAASTRTGVPWEVLAAINEVETDYGRDLSVSSAGAEGWMQFMPSVWAAYGTDATGAGRRDPYNPADAIYAAAEYLQAAGARRNLSGAIYAYNHSAAYVQSVLLRARLLEAIPHTLLDTLTGVVRGLPPVAPAARPRYAPEQVPPASVHPQAAADTASASKPVVAGVTIGAARGTVVRVAEDGTVTRIGNRGRLGRSVQVRDAWGDTYVYARLGSVAKRVPEPAGHNLDVNLRVGSWVRAGTAIGRLGVAMLFEFRPAGDGREDPRPLLDSWTQLATTEHNTGRATRATLAPNGADGTVAQLPIAPNPALPRMVLSDPRIGLDRCTRGAVDAEQVDRRGLDALERLADAGIDTVASAPGCAISGGAPLGRTLKITSVDGVSLRPGTTSDRLLGVLIRRLLVLPAEIRPRFVLSRRAVPGAAASIARPEDANDLVLDYGTLGDANAPARRAAPPVRAAAAHTAGKSAAVLADAQPLTAGEWGRLLAHLAAIPEPSVPASATVAALPDTRAELTAAPVLATAQPALAEPQVQSDASNLIYQPELGLPAGSVQMIGASPGEAPGEVWAPASWRRCPARWLVEA
jgi:hypothetical protein